MRRTCLCFCRILVAILALALSGQVAQAQWTYRNSNTPAAIRCITRTANNRLIGGRVGGSNPNTIEVWASDNNGSAWYRTGSVASSSTVQYGDPGFLSDGGTLVYCAFREHQGNSYQITVCRSTDGANSWTFDSIVANNTRNLFLGAPYLWFSRDGNVQCYYDSEQVATDSGYPGQQWIFMNARPKFAFGRSWLTYLGAASRPADSRQFARDGLASVANLDGSKIDW